MSGTSLGYHRTMDRQLHCAEAKSCSSVSKAEVSRNSTHGYDMSWRYASPSLPASPSRLQTPYKLLPNFKSPFLYNPLNPNLYRPHVHVRHKELNDHSNKKWLSLLQLSTANSSLGAGHVGLSQVTMAAESSCVQQPHSALRTSIPQCSSLSIISYIRSISSFILPCYSLSVRWEGWYSYSITEHS